MRLDTTKPQLIRRATLLTVHGDVRDLLRLPGEVARDARVARRVGDARAPHVQDAPFPRDRVSANRGRHRRQARHQASEQSQSPVGYEQGGSARPFYQYVRCPNCQISSTDDQTCPEFVLRANDKSPNGICVTDLAIGACWKRSGRIC